MRAFRHRPSAALVLGVLAGLLASFTYLPTIIPLTLQIVDAEETVARRHAALAGESVARMVETGVDPTDQTLLDLQLTSIDVRSSARGEPLRLGMAVPIEVQEMACAAGEADLLTFQDRLWAVACLGGPDHTVLVVHAPNYSSGTNIAFLVLELALVVGIITALAVLRLLRPLSQVTRALARVGAGERGVRVHTTGLAELDELVERLNAAAGAMEDREDAIHARILVVQEMARLVAHEIRNPLQSLELLTTLVATEEDASERQAIASSIHTEIRALDQVVGRLLREGARSGAIRLQTTPQPVAPLVEQVARLREPEASRLGIRLKVGPLSGRAAPVDATLLGRAVENLVLNAMQAVAPGSGEVRVTLYDDGPWLCFAVDDNGPGVDASLGDAIFEPNVTTKPGGSGLGLPLVKGVVEAHQGYIVRGRSALGGASFVARLPTDVSTLFTQDPLATSGDGEVGAG